MRGFSSSSPVFFTYCFCLLGSTVLANSTWPSLILQQPAPRQTALSDYQPSHLGAAGEKNRGEGCLPSAL